MLQMTYMCIPVQPILPTPPSSSTSNSLYDADHVRHHLQAKKLHYQPVNYNFGSHDLFSLEACLTAYTSLDILDGSNQFLCQVCSEAKGQRNKVMIIVYSLVLWTLR